MVTGAHQEARFALNIYLLKGDPCLAKEHVDMGGMTQSVEIKVGDEQTAVLHYGQMSGSPDWLARLFALAKEAPDALKSASISAILLVEANGRLFALTFGHAWQKVKISAVEPNFGIRCVLNLAEERSLRAIRRDRIAEESLQAIEQIPDSDGISRFGMNIEKDLLRGVKAKIDSDLGFGAWVAGADAFKTSIDLSTEYLTAFLSRCLKLHAMDEYKKRFSWVDNIAPLRNSSIEPILAQELSHLVTQKDVGITLSVPDLLSWDDHDYFSFERKRKGQAPCANHLELSQWVEYASAASADGHTITVDDLNNRKIYAFRQGGLENDSWPVFQCLHGIVKYKNEVYLAHSGKWFILNRDFVDATNKRVTEIPHATLVLPSSTISEHEGAFNERAAMASGGHIMLLDKKLIPHGGGSSKFEVCDLLTQNGELICVKPWGGGSGSLSHLFYQAKNAIALLNNDASFRDKVRLYIDKADPTFTVIWDYICANAEQAEVVLAILRGCSKESLPFFAKLALCDCVSDLRSMRFKCTYAVIIAV
ncbi:DUF6119 family protein [Rhodanobacter ginsengisoli]|uniref:DUF6119 family protein n=1 Tax=Rhodanobacter ginsengisoli TaxID=418646 RepID=A0ABW0QPU7_9GAMM